MTSGGELAARLGLDDTWAYFSVKRGSSVVAEPDRSGTAAPASPPAHDEQPTHGPRRPGGGAQGPAGAPESTPAGGVVAG